MFRELTIEEEKEFRDGIYEDTRIKEFLEYISMCHPVSRDEVIKAIRGMGQ